MEKTDSKLYLLLFLKHLACSVGGGRVSPVLDTEKIEILKRECDVLRIRLDHRIGGVKISKIAESYSAFFDQWSEYDPFVSPLEPSKGVKYFHQKFLYDLSSFLSTQLPSNPWIADSIDFWEMERQT